MSIQAAITHIQPVTIIRRERLLPVPGRVVVRRGQQVGPSVVVAEAVLEPEHILLDIGRGLGLKPKEADKYLVRQDGDEVGEGDVLAGPVGMARRVVRAPRTGRIVVAGEGQVLLQADTQPYELRAAYSGVIADLIPDRGVVVETIGSLVQGVWGNERLNYGLMNILAKAPDEIIRANQLDVSLRGFVLLAGYCENPEVLQAGEELPLRGLILASMSSRLIPDALKVSYPVILVEGFGKLAMNSAAFKLLSSSERREAAVNAEHWNRLTGARPEVVLSLTAQAQASPLVETGIFAANQSVRVVMPPYQGKLATLLSVSEEAVALPSGVRALAGNLRFENGETALVPLANLELIL